MSKKSTLFARLPDTPLSYPPRLPIQQQRYVVGWPDLGIIKIGSTSKGRARWGAYLARGATMIDLACYDNAIKAETHLETLISKKYGNAFSHKTEAKDILGKNGAGWLECYAIPYEEWDQVQTMIREENTDGLV